MKPTRAGNTENISVSMPAELVSELRSRTGRRGLSGYITEAVRHQLAMDGLAEIVAAHEEEHGPLTEQEVEAARRELFGEEDARGVGRGAA
ncbi:hypothetical protein [Actinacidiphila epipremni]|uniref:CopG family transcriptional regulator n=1 Tax=Actinacidiphila epipremni TaxID=2053013 RepID=A0ABX0ZHI6_9ACTN|nr:hypothetical protein [Actinacidiphila epipremni]NJP42602.1 hypothetical protein [Actinacidiphila epipremni]